MRSNPWPAASLALVAVGVLSLSMFAQAAPPTGETDTPASKKGVSKKAPVEKPEVKAASSNGASKGERRILLEAVRERAKLVHNIYATTLDVIHHRYFRGDRTAIPARSLEDVFSVIAKEENSEANWIAVNTKAMSINHRPKGEFEKQAATRIAAGDEAYESVEGGVYRRAQGISLMNKGCLGCHLGFGAADSKVKRFAGLVIEIPVEDK